MGFWVWGLGLGVLGFWGLWFGVWGFGFPLSVSKRFRDEGLARLHLGGLLKIKLLAALLRNPTNPKRLKM